MPDYVVCTRAIRGGSFSSEPGPTRFLKVPDKRNPDPSQEINCTGLIPDDVGTFTAEKFGTAGAEVKLTVHTQNAAGDSPVVGPVVIKLI